MKDPKTRRSKNVKTARLQNSDSKFQGPKDQNLSEKSYLASMQLDVQYVSYTHAKLIDSTFNTNSTLIAYRSTKIANSLKSGIGQFELAISRIKITLSLKSFQSSMERSYSELPSPVLWNFNFRFFSKTTRLDRNNKRAIKPGDSSFSQCLEYGKG